MKNAGTDLLLLGFAEQTSFKNQAFAYHTGRYAALKGLRLLTGNLRSTFAAGIQGALREGGRTLTLIETAAEHRIDASHIACIRVPSASVKYLLLVEQAAGAVIIGGGPRTLMMARRLIAAGKPIVALRGSQGVVDNELHSVVPTASRAFDAVDYITDKIRWRIPVQASRLPSEPSCRADSVSPGGRHAR